MDTPLLDATDRAIAVATHLTAEDAAAVEAMRALARKIDVWDRIVEWAVDDVAGERGARPAVPQNDNVSLASYLKYCESLGLTPAGRERLAKPKKSEESSGDSNGGSLASLRAQQQKRAAKKRSA